MKKIAIILPDSCYAPEVYALDDYLKKHSDNIYSEILSYNDFVKKQYYFDLVYKMMGFSRVFFNDCKIPEIHDYASLSTGSLAKVKDSIKRNFQKKPIHRFFLNKKVKDIMNFNDGVEFTYRDMGVDDHFYMIRSLKEKKVYDFCYVGSITDDRKINIVLDLFLENKKFNIVLVGDNNLSNKDKYLNQDNILFLGKKDRIGVVDVLSKSRVGVNFTPDVYPFNIQTSTKVLEYIASGLDVISNEYEWANFFQKEIGFNFLNFSDLTLPNFEFRSTFNFSDKVTSWKKIFDDAEIIKIIETV